MQRRDQRGNMDATPLADVDNAVTVTAGIKLELELLADHGDARAALKLVEPATLPPPVVPEEESHAGLTDAERLIDLVSKAKGLHVFEKYTMVDMVRSCRLSRLTLLV